ncbi:MAG: NAD(P)/FAD-dependent oxidoreductase [Propionibacteriaceae bacterium]
MVVIGAGVIGTAIASQLSRTLASVCVLESAEDVAEGASKANAGITSSYYAPKGTLDCELLNESNDDWEDLCARLRVPYQRIGALTVALDEEGLNGLDALEADVRAAGVAVERLTGDEARKLEPLLTPECLGALHYPDEGIIDPMRLTWAYAELAGINGVPFIFSAPVTAFKKEAGRIVAAQTPHGMVHGRFFVNAAGIGSGTVSALAGGEEIRMWPRRGQYWILDRDFGETVSRIVLPVPTATTRGIEVAPTTNGSVILGPDAVEGGASSDTETDRSGLAIVFELTQRLMPSISLDRAIKSYAGNRPAADEPIRVRPDHIVPNLLHAGNRSTGVSTSPAIARRIVRILGELRVDVSERKGATDRLDIRPRLREEAAPEQRAERQSTEEMVVCLCEQVTAAEVDHAVNCAVPARSIEGVRKRTRATGGRCQGSLCMAGVIFMCANAGLSEPGNVGMGSRGGVVGDA